MGTLPAGEPDASAAAGLEPYGGNLYRPHMWQVNSGRFWRCAHGVTGWGAAGGWEGCGECRAEEPKLAKEWERLRPVALHKT